MLLSLVEKFKQHQAPIEEWFSKYEAIVKADPIYASIDLRNGGYKIAPVDTNIFPAGWNNLCPSYRREAGKLFREHIDRFFPQTQKIAILAEEHTRNLYYFENLFALQNLLRGVGFEVEIASLSENLAEGENRFVGAEGNPITIWKTNIAGDVFKIPPFTAQLILINNDFSAGLPKAIKKLRQPLVPTPFIGWHRRKKSHHFTCYEKLATEFSNMIGIDTWLLSARFRCMGEIDFNDAKSMTRLATKVDVLLSEIRAKYREYSIPHEPYVFVKNDAGTYGMAVMTATSGEQLTDLNKRQRAAMKVGKNRRLVTEVIIQEGIPTVDRFKGLVAEPVIYLVGNSVCGGFFRLNETNDSRGNLNQPGMKFTKLCFHEMMGYSNEYRGECDLECLSMIYKNIARIASIAAGFEIRMAKFLQRIP